MARIALSTKPFKTGSSAAAAARGSLDGLIIAGLVALFLITFVIGTFYIPSVSMVPALQVGDTVLVDEIVYRFAPPADGDVAIFKPPLPSGGENFIKRVVGAPGDRLTIADGVLYRNGAAVTESFENQPPEYSLAIRDYGIYVNGRPLDPHAANVPPKSRWQAPNRIPERYYFVLGDNRNYSDDSHVWGFVDRASFVGRAFLVLWPLRRLHVLEK